MVSKAWLLLWLVLWCVGAAWGQEPLWGCWCWLRCWQGRGHFGGVLVPARDCIRAGGGAAWRNTSCVRSADETGWGEWCCRLRWRVRPCTSSSGCRVSSWGAEVESRPWGHSAGGGPDSITLLQGPLLLSPVVKGLSCCLQVILWVFCLCLSCWFQISHLQNCVVVSLCCFKAQSLR